MNESSNKYQDKYIQLQQAAVGVGIPVAAFEKEKQRLCEKFKDDKVIETMEGLLRDDTKSLLAALWKARLSIKELYKDGSQCSVRAKEQFDSQVRLCPRHVDTF